MRRPVRPVAACALALLATLLAGAAAAASAPPVAAGDTVYVVVRHAQKATGEDPPLTAEGEAHARALADALADAGVRAIYATPYRRTLATAAPLAERSGVAVTRYEPGDAPATAAAIRAAAHGGTVLVVGHSNTVPALVEALSGVAVAPMPETDYTRMYVVVVGAGGRARLLRLSMP